MATTLRDLSGFISWYLIISVIGLITFPLAYKFLPNLRDKGYAFIRGIGLLLWGFIFWLLASLKVIENNAAGQVLALIILCLISGWRIRKQRWRGMATWMTTNKKLVIVTELVFLGAFALWAFVRSANPEIVGTEKPMELAFINSILNSPGIPPDDPWLSGYAISYYYFGFVLVAMLTRLSGVLPGIGFNLSIALWFGLSAVSAYGIIYDLLATRKRRRGVSKHDGLLAWPLFGPLFLLIVANLEGFLEILHSCGLFWKKLSDGTYVSAFWKWLDVLDLSSPPSEPLSWFPIRYIPWWRASRVLQDYSLLDSPREIIDEFPHFSYLLADLHPHLLAMPFVLLGIAIALNLYKGRDKTGLSVLGIHLPLTWGELIFSGLCLGGLGFLNIWDFPFAVLLFCGAFLLRQGSIGRPFLSIFVDTVLLFILVSLAGVLLYLPFYLSFSSQAGGLIPSLIFFTRGAHFWVMFAPLLAPLFAYIFLKSRKAKAGRRFWKSLLISFALLGVAFILMIFLGWIGWSIPGIRVWLEATFNAQGQSYLLIVLVTLQRRLAAPGTWLTLIAITAGVLMLLSHKKLSLPVEMKSSNAKPRRYMRKPDFVLVILGVGIVLLTIPEFFYLRDQFGWRMNTIFKFYFHGWILLSISAAYAFIRVFQLASGRIWGIIKAGLLTILIASLVYAPVMLEIKTNHYGTLQSRTLDGNQYFIDMYPEEAWAIKWLGIKEPGIVAEAIGGSYTGYARVSTLSGFPTVLGWPGHEGQWRGGEEEMGTRAYDIEMLYTSNDWDYAESIIEKYNIRYIFIGNLERSTYHVNDAKLRQHLPVIFEQDSVVILETALYEQ